MTSLERTALSFVTTWVLLDAFTPGAPYNQRIQLCLITTISIGYLYGLHNQIFRRICRLFRKRSL